MKNKINKTSNITKWAAYLTAFLLFFLPFNATFANFMIFGLDLGFIKWNIWKEAIVLVLFILLVIEIIRTKQYKKLKLEALDYFILAYFLLGLITGLLWTKNLYHIFVGAKYDFSFLALYLCIRNFNFNTEQVKMIIKWTLTAIITVVLFGFISYFLLPANFMTVFGYLPVAGGQSWIPGGALPMYHTVGIDGVLIRLASTFSGPNNYSFYLLFAVPFLLFKNYKTPEKTSWFQKIKKYFSIKEKDKSKFFLGFMFTIAFISLLLTFSRSAYLGLAAIIFTGALILFKSKRLFWTIITSAFVFLFIGIGAIYVSSPNTFNQIFLRASSSSGHFDRTVSAFYESLEYPWGEGLGKAGPASCYFPDEFGGCLIPENWYLQVALEMGYLGMLIFIIIIVMILNKLYNKYKKEQNYLSLSLFLTIIGLSVASMFLHAWEDASTSLTVWALCGLLLNNNYGKRFTISPKTTSRRKGN